MNSREIIIFYKKKPAIAGIGKAPKKDIDEVEKPPMPQGLMSPH